MTTTVCSHCPIAFVLAYATAIVLELTFDVLRPTLYIVSVMILGYRDRRTERFAMGDFVPAFQRIDRQAARRLSILDAAPSLDTLKSLTSNRLELLRGDRAGQYSIRINRQWRICFRWPSDIPGPVDVEIVDYH